MRAKNRKDKKHWTKASSNTKEAMWRLENQEADIYRKAAMLFNQYKRNQHQRAAI